eukprot:5275487-Prymnesium_polylepis.1
MGHTPRVRLPCWKVAPLSATRMSVCKNTAAAPPTMPPCTAHAIGTSRLRMSTKPRAESSTCLKAADSVVEPRGLYGFPPAQKTLPAPCTTSAWI